MEQRLDEDIERVASSGTQSGELLVNTLDGTEHVVTAKLEDSVKDFAVRVRDIIGAKTPVELFLDSTRLEKGSLADNGCCFGSALVAVVQVCW